MQSISSCTFSYPFIVGFACPDLIAPPIVVSSMQITTGGVGSRSLLLCCWTRLSQHARKRTTTRRLMITKLGYDQDKRGTQICVILCALFRVLNLLFVLISWWMIVPILAERALLYILLRCSVSSTDSSSHCCAGQGPGGFRCAEYDLLNTRSSPVDPVEGLRWWSWPY